VHRWGRADENPEDPAKASFEGRLWTPASVSVVPLDRAVVLTVGPHVSDDLVPLLVRKWPRIDDCGVLELQELPQQGINVTLSALYRWSGGGGYNPAFVLSGFDEGKSYAVSLAPGRALPADDRFGLDAIVPPLEEITDELDLASSTTFVPYAWRVWTDWLGDLELIARIARAGIEAFRDESGEATVDIRVHVLGDVERFASPQAFLTDLTRQAASTFDTVWVTVALGPVRAEVTLTRKKDPYRPWLSNAVVLEVTGAVDTTPATVAGVSDHISAAIHRGQRRGGDEPKDGQGFRATSNGRTNYGPQQALARRLSMWWVMGVVLGIAMYLVGAPVLEAWGKAAVIPVSSVFFLVVLFFAGWRFWYPGVELGRSTHRASAILKRAAKAIATAGIVTGIVGVVLPYLVKRLLLAFGWDLEN
jgi:hypothetical protein